MKRFANLLKKEIKELVTKQLIISLAFTVILFNFIGQVSKKEVQKAVGVQTISALDQDGSAASQALIQGPRVGPLQDPRPVGQDQGGGRRGRQGRRIEAPPRHPQRLRRFPDRAQAERDRDLLLHAQLLPHRRPGLRSSSRASSPPSTKPCPNNFLKEKLPDMDPASLKKPIKSKDFVIVQDKMAEGSANMVAGLISQQSMLIPVVLMMIVIYSSQMVISAVAMEKQNKTLETLLTVPIKRTSIITAKMLAAGLIGLISAGVYMFGFQGFLGGIGEEAAKAGAQAGGARADAEARPDLRHDRATSSSACPSSWPSWSPWPWP